MPHRILFAGAAVLGLVALAAVQAGEDEPKPTPEADSARAASTGLETPRRVVKSDAEWRQLLTDQQFYVTRRKGTEPAFSGRYWNYHGDGIYRCVCCESPLFDSRTKFESGTGWPSFFAPISKTAVRTRADRSLFQVRTEVLCRVCDAHLGHVFKDGPRPTGLRFCMNSASLTFQSRAEAEAEAAAKAILEAEPSPDQSDETAAEGEPASADSPDHEAPARPLRGQPAPWR